MKKLLFGFLCIFGLAFFTRVYAEKITVEEVKEAFNQTELMQSLLELSDQNELFEIELDEENHRFNVILLEEDTNERQVYMYYTYSEDDIRYEDNNTSASDLSNEFGKTLVVTNTMYTIFDLSGFSDKFIELEDVVTNTEEFFDTYGLYIKTEDYSDEVDGWTSTGTILREFRMSFDKDKIAKLIEDYGVDRDSLLEEEENVPEGLAPTLSVTNVTDTTISLSAYVDDESDTQYMCKIYHFNNKTGEFELYDNTAYGCSFDGLSYVFDGLTPNTQYYFKAIIAGGDTFSNIVDVTTLKSEQDDNNNNNNNENTAPVVVVENLNEFKIASVGEKNVKLSWNKVSSAKGYIVYQSTNGKKWKKLATIKNNNTLTYNNKKLKAGTKYYYKVVAYKVVNKKNKTITTSKVLKTITTPVKPKLKVKTSTYNSVTINVSKVKGASKYIVERSTDKKNYELVAELKKAGNYKDKTVITGTKYYYRVRACSTNCSKNTKVVSAKPALKKPTFKLTSGKNKATIKIAAVSGATGYVVERGTKKNKGFVVIENLAASTKNFGDLNLTSKKTYYYRIRAYRIINGKTVYSPYSKVMKVKVK